MVQQLAAPSQLAEEHGGTGIVAAMDEAMSYRSLHACDRALPAEKEVGFAEIDEAMASTSALATIIDEK